MTLFVVVARNKRDGREYLLDAEPEGYTEFSSAHAHADAEQDQVMDHIQLYVGKVVPVEAEGGP
jgi:hypothetical protein